MTLVRFKDMQSEKIEDFTTTNSFYRGKIYIICLEGKIMHMCSSEEQINNYLLNPTTCLRHSNPDDNIHTECWAEYPDYKFTRINLESDKYKFVIGLPALYGINQFGHIWQGFYYKLFAVLMSIKKNNKENKSKIIMLSSNKIGMFAPTDPYYKSFTDNLLKDFEIEDFEYSNKPTIYEIDNVWACNGDYTPHDMSFVNDYLFDKSIKPWRKLYVDRSAMFGKKLRRSMAKDFFKDNGYDNVFSAWQDLNIFNKRVYNEDDLKSFLEQYGFECFDPGMQFHKKQCKKIIRNNNGFGYVYVKVECVGGCRIEDLIQYMNEVKVIVAVSSSSLQNILFMDRENSHVIELLTKFYQMQGVDSDRVIRETAEAMTNPLTGEFDIETMNKVIRKILRQHGEIHAWHRELAVKLGIDYSYVMNSDLNGRTLIKSIKDHDKIFKLVSE